MAESGASSPPKLSLRQRLCRLRRYLFPQEAEQDPSFREEIRKLSVRALYVISGVMIILPIVGVVFHSFAEVFDPMGTHASWGILAFPAGALVLCGAARTAFGRRHSRSIALFSGFYAATVLTWFQLTCGFMPEQAVLRSMLEISGVLVVGLVAIPALPVQVFGLGVSVGLMHWISTAFAQSRGLIPDVSLHHYAGLDVFILLCTGLAAVNYHRIRDAYHSYQRDLAAQSRLLVYENAALMGRFAATLSHELNTPIGALTSTMDSLHRVAERRRVASEPERERLREIESGLFRTASKSAEQLRTTLDRIRRYTNLDRAEVLAVDLQELLRDVTEMVRPDAQGRAQIDLEVDPLPQLSVRPQEISAVFSNLLHNAINVAPAQGRVAVRARQRNSHIEVTVKDEGPGIDANDIAQVFEPGFRTEGSRVTGGNWGLFSSRRVIREHGGDIEVLSEPGAGTEVKVTLPLVTRLAAAGAVH